MMILRGMYGVGDNIHQRAVVRTLMDRGVSVVLETFYRAMYDDLVQRGLRLKLLAGIPPRIREREPLKTDITLPRNHASMKITYNASEIHRCGSILAAQYACVGLRMPERPNFSLPVRREWRQCARERVGAVSKPLLVYRPIVLNNVWKAEARAPDPDSYATIFRSIRDRYHVVSIANLGDAGESIVGDVQDADTSFNHGELDFETMVGLFAEAELTFACPGMAPVLSQAVGTRTVVVYGANECHRTTSVVGDHLAPTLAIEPDVPCSHHAKTCDCSKHITLGPAIERLETFACAS